MRATLICFSQTGSTLRVAEAVAQGLRAAGCVTGVLRLEKVDLEEIVASDVLGVGAPTFSSQAPTPIKAFLRTLPDMMGKPAFCFATSGGAPGRVLYDLATSLRRKGARIVAGFKTRGAVRHPAPGMNGRFAARPDSTDLASATLFGEALTLRLRDPSGAPGVGVGEDPCSPPSDFYGVLGTLTTDPTLRRLMPAPNPVPDKCDRCGWCVEACPMRNIRLDSTPRLGNRCIRCYRCLNGCPSEALRANWLFADRFLRTVYSPTMLRRFGDLAADERMH